MRTKQISLEYGVILCLLVYLGEKGCAYLPRARGQRWLRTAKPRASVDSLAVRSSVRASHRGEQGGRDNSRGYALATALPAAALPAQKCHPPTNSLCNSRHTHWQPAGVESRRQGWRRDVAAPRAALHRR